MEGLRVEAYQDVVGVWSIGFGHTGPEVVKGYRITVKQAEDLLDLRLSTEFEPAIRDAIKVDLSQAQYDALVSFSYNIGVRAFTNSTMVKKINLKDFGAAADEFDKWHKPVQIIERRNKEKRMFVAGS